VIQLSLTPDVQKEKFKEAQRKHGEKKEKDAGVGPAFSKRIVFMVHLHI
jgi:hypothetical protein